MFKLEKVFQNDDSAYILFVNIIKTVIILFSYYIFSILEKDTIYDLFNFNIYAQSKYFLFSIILCFTHLCLNLINKKDSNYKRNFISFLKEDFFNFIVSNIIVLSLFFIFKNKFLLDISYLYSCVFLIFTLSLTKLSFNYLYDYLINENIIQTVCLINTFLGGIFIRMYKILINNIKPTNNPVIPGIYL